MRVNIGILLFLMAVLVIGGCGGSSSDNMSTQSLDFVLYQTEGVVEGDYIIQGTVFNDLDHPGVWNTDEPGIPGVTVSLVGMADTVTDPTGTYAFGVDAAGAYTVQITPLPGYVHTTPAEVSAAVSDSVTTVNFGLEAEIITYSIFGFVYNDMDGSGMMEMGETGVPGALVTLYDDVDDSEIASQMTPVDGSYAFEVADTGTYTVVETDPEGYVSTTPNEMVAAVADTDVRIDFGDWMIQDVDVDMKPGSKMNPINLKSKGVLPVAILGSEDLDVMDIDPTTLLLNGVAPLRFNYTDVCGQNDKDMDDEEMGDGYMDMTLKFSTQAIAATLGDVERGDLVKLIMTGELISGRPAEGEEVAWVVQGPKSK